MSQLTSIRNNSGFTLIELLVAMVIMTVGMFGVLETINVSLQHNLKNELRNEGVKVGEQYMTDLRGKTFSKYSTSYALLNVTKNVRGVNKQYVVDRQTQVLAQDAITGPTSMQLTVTVKWAFRNLTTQNRVVSVVAKP